MKLFKGFGKFIVALFLALCVLSGVCVIYCYSYRMPNLDETTEKKALPNQFLSDMEEGFFWDRFDKNGFNNAYIPKKETIDILIIGSSQIEAAHFDTNKNIGYLLNDFLPDLYTYNIAISGMFLKQNLSKLKNAYEYYKPQKYVLLGLGDLRYGVSELKEIYDGSYYRKPNRNKKKPLLISYTWEKLKGRIDAWKSSSKSVLVKNNNQPQSSSIQQEYVVALESLIGFMRKQVPDNIKLIWFYYPACSLNTDGTLKFKDSEYISIYQELCRKNNIHFLDLTENFVELYKSKHVLPYGFLNTIPGSGHLNEYGHRVIAEALADKISELEKENK